MTYDPSKDPNRVTAERCASLILVAIANGLDEVWISKNPILFFTYILQYCPNFGMWSVCSHTVLASFYGITQFVLLLCTQAG